VNREIDPNKVIEEPRVPSERALLDEYNALGEDLRHTGGRVDAARSFGVVTVGAVLTLAIQQQLAVLALAAEILTYCFTLIDLVNSHGYASFAQRARRIELALDDYQEAERNPGDASVLAKLQRRLGGLGRRPYQAVLNEPGRSALVYTQPRPVFRYLYPLLFVGSAILAVLIQVRNGSGAELVAVVAGALIPLALFLPRFADPKWAAIEWWREKDGTRLRKFAWFAIPLLVAALLILAVSWALPAFRIPPDQASQALSIGAMPPVGSLRARLDISPSCSSARGILNLSWRGRTHQLQIRLPENLESADGQRSLVLHPRASSQMIPLIARPAEELAGRCTLALPALVGSGETSAGLTRLRLPRRFAGFELTGAHSGASGHLGPCGTAVGSVPVSTCAGQLHIVEAGSSDERLRSIARAGGAVVMALALVFVFLLTGVLARRRKVA
jgi:hypothetical protein